MARSATLVALPFISTRVTRALAAASQKKLGFPLCGLGNLSTHQIAPALQKTANCRLAGIVTGTPGAGRRGLARRANHDGHLRRSQQRQYHSFMRAESS